MLKKIVKFVIFPSLFVVLMTSLMLPGWIDISLAVVLVLAMFLYSYYQNNLNKVLNFAFVGSAVLTCLSFYFPLISGIAICFVSVGFFYKYNLE